MVEDAEQGGEAPCWAHLTDELDQHAAPTPIVGSNTILYSDRWPDLVAFYRNGLGLRTSMERNWFVEFELHPGAHISVADSSRASIPAGNGSGLTLSWLVDDAGATRARLVASGIDASPIQTRWDAPAFFVIDPAGNRIEFWSAGT